ncbi:heparan-alpha-glucosaminide N-acetyltransferase [Ditylenchus destructor]|uniref:Heparan-alpha-glucosaminide N-acetyltransferase n=1 Tax=Ditylenchus destructor TaxID=166010 RepID=A0AAD4QV57_9BILA|nr:heparan-alpha-glucosaminide N-acetyltransferase [Ditylenchus destructor]
MSVMPIDDQKNKDVPDRDIGKHIEDGSFCDPPLPQAMSKQTSHRFPALDVFRGITLCGMCVGINPIFFEGLLAHAEWSGFTPSDLGLPSFVFIMGCSVSFAERRLGTLPIYKAVYTILKRTTLLFLCGFIYEWFPFADIDVNSELISPFPIGITRIMGVLQRIGLCYCITALLAILIRRFQYIVIIAAALPLVYWPVLYFFSTAPPGNDPYAIDKNAVLRFDLWVLGQNHILDNRFDNEGLLSTLPALSTSLFGYLTGKFIQTYQKRYKLIKMSGFGAVSVVIGLLWSVVLPINKKLWTGSFVALCLGLDVIILVLLMLGDRLSEMIPSATKKRLKFASNGANIFLMVLGRNSLLIFLVCETIYKWARLIPAVERPEGGAISLFEWITQPFLEGPLGNIQTAAAISAISVLIMAWTTAYTLNRKGIYVRL